MKSLVEALLVIAMQSPMTDANAPTVEIWMNAPRPTGDHDDLVVRVAVPDNADVVAEAHIALGKQSRTMRNIKPGKSKYVILHAREWYKKVDAGPTATIGSITLEGGKRWTFQYVYPSEDSDARGCTWRSMGAEFGLKSYVCRAQLIGE